jgi:hypothetical protein
MLDLREEWADLLARRPELRETLAVYGHIIGGWAAWSAPPSAPLAWDQAACRDRWRRGVPLLAEGPPALAAADLEDLLGATMEQVAAVREDARPGLQRLATAWDEGTLGPGDLLPRPGRIGSEALAARSGLEPDLLAVLACGTLRPALDAYLGPSRAHLDEHVWRLGVCPGCGAPPGFADILDDGRRRLACHVCGGGWLFSRAICPLCGAERTEDLVRLEPEPAREQGYVIIACRQCRGYVKELDRRVRWNGRSALVEDWGSPHFDLVAEQAGYWRPLPGLVRSRRRPETPSEMR